MKLALPCLTLLALLAASGARADCAMPEAYRITEEAGKVTVCLQTSGDRTCPDLGLLRREVDSQEIVKLSTCDGSGCFVDECVPAGTYQYGLQDPYACHELSCGTFFYGQIAVTGAAPECARTGAAPASASSVPWGTTATVCEYRHRSTDSAFGCTSSGAVLGLNGLVLVAGALLWRRRSRRG